jgi:peptidoglycan/LPS O-acetylase OafA/YrhL
MPLLEFLNSFASRLDNLWFTVSWLGMVLTAAFLSFRYFERPLMTLAPAQPTALPVAPVAKDSEEELDLEKTF